MEAVIVLAKRQWGEGDELGWVGAVPYIDVALNI